MEGVKQLKKTATVDARFVFIRPPSLEILERQLRGRGTETEESIQRRLTRAKDEMEYAETGAHDEVIVNDDLETALRQLEDFLLPFEKSQN
ncbi:P-loop containing nucleoside triphosphate hydrolase protein, partial [Plectosphaerella cucumerina]